MRSLTSSYAGRRILVTGQSGFKGGWLMEMLAVLGAQPIGFGLEAAYSPSLGHLLRLSDRFPCIRGDVRDAAAVDAAFRTHQPDLVVHMAAQPLVRLSYDCPAETFAVNVQGTVHLLDAVRRYGTPAAVMVTSDKVYRNDGSGRAFRETDPLGGRDPYSASKAAADLAVDMFRSSFFGGDNRPRVASVRAGNIIGGGDWSADRLIPDFCRATYERQEPLVIRNPQATRPWQHVLDALAGYLTVGARLLGGSEDVARAWNFGPSLHDVLTVRNVVERCIMQAGRGAVLTVPDAAKPEAATLQIDSTDARQLLGWSPLMTSDEAITATIEWYRSFYHPAARSDAMITLTQGMIGRYAAACAEPRPQPIALAS